MSSRPIIVNLFGDIPRHEKSHVRGWFLSWQHLLMDTALSNDTNDIHTASKIYVSAGPNYTPGQMNLFGGVTDPIAAKWKALIDNKHRVCFLDYHPRDLALGFLNRASASSTSAMFTTKLAKDLAAWVTQDVETLTMRDMARKSSLILGDSHSVAYAYGYDAVLKHDGRLAHSAIRNDWVLDEIAGLEPTRVTLCFGSIDIRHHVHRQTNPEVEINRLTTGLVDAADKIRALGIGVALCAPVPVEPESRRIPKTGFFAGEPFAGSQEVRAEYTRKFTEQLKAKSDCPVIEPRFSGSPEEWMDEWMELASSVHIGPHRYRRFNANLWRS